MRRRRLPRRDSERPACRPALRSARYKALYRHARRDIATRIPLRPLLNTIRVAREAVWYDGNPRGQSVRARWVAKRRKAAGLHVHVYGPASSTWRPAATCRPPPAVLEQQGELHQSSDFEPQAEGQKLNLDMALENTAVEKLLGAWKPAGGLGRGRSRLRDEFLYAL